MIEHSRIETVLPKHGPTDGAYEQVFSKVVLPELEAVAGLSDAYLLRRQLASEVEFVALTIFESLSAVRDFAGEDYETAVISSEAKQVLKRFEERAAPYETVIAKNGRALDVEAASPDQPASRR